MSKPSLTTTALAAAILAAASVLVFSLTPHLFVWAAFIGWASYDHSGATPQAAARSSAALVFGVIMAWAVAAAAASGMIPLNATVATAICAGIASFFIVLAAWTSILSVVPATFYGFASTFVYLSLAPGASTIQALTAARFENVLVTMPVSLLIGTGIGIAHAKLAGRLTLHPSVKQAPLTPLSQP
jgi:hypothetical protein